MAGEDSGSRVCKTGSPGFGWLCLARSVLALVVTVIAAIVLVKGMILVLQFDTSMIQLNVAQSDVFIYWYEKTMMHKTTYNYVFRFYLEANNPSEVLFITYSNITVQLRKDDVPFATFDLFPSSLSLSQKEEQEYFVSVITDNVTLNGAVQQNLFPNDNGGTMEGAAMVLYGHLTVLDLQRSVNKFDDLHTNFTCKSVMVKSTHDPVSKPSPQNYKTECLKG